MNAPLFGPGVATPESISRRRRMAESLMGAGIDTSPVQHWTQGAARMANALAGGWGMRKADQAEQEGRSGATQKMIQMLSSPNGMDPTALAEMASDPWVDQGVSSALLQRRYAGKYRPGKKMAALLFQSGRVADEERRNRGRY